MRLMYKTSCFLVFQYTSGVPTVNEIRQHTVSLTFKQQWPWETPGGYQVRYQVIPGNGSVAYGMKIPLVGGNRDYTTDVTNLQQNTQYNFQVLRFVTDKGIDYFNGISQSVYVRIPSEPGMCLSK